MNKITITKLSVYILILSTLILIPPTIKAGNIWHVGEGGDFTNIMDAMSSNLVSDGDTLYLVSNIHDEFYGGGIDRSIIIMGNGYKWIVHRYALPNQLEIIDSNVSIHNINIEFVGWYSKHLITLRGLQSSVYLYDVILNISEGGGLNNIISDIFQTATAGNYTIHLKNVTISVANDIILNYLIKTNIRDSYLVLNINELTVEPSEGLVMVNSKDSEIRITINSMTTPLNTYIINSTLIDTAIYIQTKGIRYINGESSGINILSMETNTIDIKIDNAIINNSSNNFIHISNYNSSTIDITAINTQLSKTSLIDQEIYANKSTINIKLMNITFNNAQDSIKIDLTKSSSSINMNNIKWVDISPCINVVGKNSSLNLEISNLTIPRDVDKFLTLSATEGTLEGAFSNIMVDGFARRPLEITLRNTSIKLNISNILSEKIVQYGFKIVARDTDGSLYLNNINIPIVNRKIGLITLINSSIHMEMINISYGTSLLDGLYITGDEESAIYLTDVDLSRCSGWSLYVQGGVVNIINSNISKIYVTTANLTFINSTFDEVNSLIFYSNITVKYNIIGRLTSIVTREPLYNIKVSIYDNKGNLLTQGYTNEQGIFTISLEYSINQTYRAYPLEIRFTSQHYNWSISTGEKTVRYLELKSNYVIHRIRIYKYSPQAINLVTTIYLESDLSTIYVNIGNISYSGRIIQLDEKVLYMYFEINNKYLIIMYLTDAKYGLVYFFEPYPICIARIE